jgi:DCN1-like protein 1/2
LLAGRRRKYNFQFQYLADILICISASSTSLDTLTKQKSYIKSQVSRLSIDLPVFKKVYRHAFFANKERSQRALDLEVAIGAWKGLFAPPGWTWATESTDWLELWVQYLEQKWTKSVNKDMWNQTFEFFQKSLNDDSMGFWSEDGAWPGVIDDFVVYVKEHRAGSSDKMETD